MKRISVLLTLAALTLAAPAAVAQSDLGLKRIGGAVGIIDPEGIGSTFSLGLFADHGTVAPHIGLESHLDYWSKSEQYFGTGSSIRDISLSMKGKYLFETTNPKIRPFLGVGLGVHFLKAEASIPPMGPFPGSTVEATSTELGFDLGGGIGTPVSPKLDLIGETWFGIVDTANTFTVRAALSYKLGQ